MNVGPAQQSEAREKLSRLRRALRAHLDPALELQQGLLEQYNGLITRRGSPEAEYALSRLAEAYNRRGERAPYGVRLVGVKAFLAFSASETEPCTVETFGQCVGGRVRALQAEVTASADALADYCTRCGLSACALEQYLAERTRLTAACYSAEQALCALLHQDGADAGRVIDKRA